MTASSAGGSVRGNDQESIDRTQCSMSWRRRSKKGAGIETIYCEGKREEVKAVNGGLCGYHCTRCSAQYDLNGALIRTTPRER